jgi:Ca2+/H+ antiporter
MRIKIVVILTVYFWLYRLMTDTEEVQNIYQFSFLLWCIIYFMGIRRDDLIMVAAYFVFPCFIIFQAYRQISGLLIYYKSDGRDKISTLNTSYVLSVVTLMAYAFMLRYEEKKEEYNAKNKQASNKLKVLKDSNWAMQKEIMYNIIQLIRIVMPAFRYLALLSALSAGLMNLNLPNSVLILWTFILMNSSERDCVQWPKYFFFMIFLILNLYFSRAADGKFQTLNSEIISIFGAYAKNRDLCKCC